MAKVLPDKEMSALSSSNMNSNMMELSTLPIDQSTKEKPEAATSSTNELPPSIPDDDDKENRGPREGNANFHIKSVWYSYSKTSFGMTEESNIRQVFVRIKVNEYFRISALLLVILNSIILAMADFSKVKANGDLETDGSSRNQLIENSDLWFIIIFAIEALIKIVAMGIYSSRGGGYLNSAWNWLDGVVVLTGLFSDLIPNSSSVRALRSLRPLKVLKHVPGIGAMINALVVGAQELANVLFIILLICVCFSVAGVVFFNGPYMHTRCRLTPYPVKTTWSVGADFETHRCLAVNTFSVPADNFDWIYQSDSPWSTPQNCFWPTDQDDPRACALTKWGHHKCGDGKWCGSNYDALGNFRFLYLSVAEKAEDYNGDRNWGYTKFDNVGYGFVTVFQILSGEAWNELMAVIRDAIGPLAIVYVVVLVIVGGLVFLNLFLAVIEDNFHGVVDDDDDKAGEGSGADEEGKKTTEDKVLPVTTYVPTHEFIPISDDVQPPKKKSVRSDGILQFVFLHIEHYLGKIEMELETSAHKHFQPVIDLCVFIVNRHEFEHFVHILVLANAIILSLDHYPSTHTFIDTSDAINFILVVFFTIELFVKLIGIGFIKYFSNEFNILDFLVVVLSWIDIGTTPPAIFGGDYTVGGTAAAIRAMRLFRMFRLFKIMARNKKLKSILEKLARTGEDLRNFGIPLVMIIFIYAVIGMNLYANKLRFDEFGYKTSPIHSYAWNNAVDRPDRKSVV